MVDQSVFIVFTPVCIVLKPLTYAFIWLLADVKLSCRDCPVDETGLEHATIGTIIKANKLIRIQKNLIFI
jgi:hypothetical protein